MQDASTQAQHSLRKEAWSGGASCWDGSLSLSCWLTFPLLPILTVSISLSFQNSLQITRNYIYYFTGYPGIAGIVVPADIRGTRTSFGLPLRGSPKICNLFRAPDGLYFPGCIQSPTARLVSNTERNLDSCALCLIL
jgi:hypothetical protein